MKPVQAERHKTMATEKKQGWDLLPSWDNVGPTWGQLFDSANQTIAFKIKLASVKASGWAVGKSEQECESEAKRRLMEGE